MVKKVAIGTICLLVSIFIVGKGRAQSLGNVIGMEETRGERVAVEYDYVGRIVEENGEMPTGKFEITSHRFFIKGTYGLSDYVDFSLKLGAANLRVPSKDASFNDFQGDTRFAYGGGVKIEPIKMGRSGFLIVGQGVSFTSQGSIQNSRFRISNRYHWREYQAALAFTTQIKPVNLYVGLEKTWLDGKKDWTQYLISSHQSTAKGSDDFSDDQQSLRPVIGVDIQLPQGYALSLEAGGVGRDEITLMLGFSQKSSR